ncbi:hypothetical protein STEG23_024022 [Scotinomys teguina]
MCRLSWFLDPGGWSKTAAVGLYFIFPEICTLSLNAAATASGPVNKQRELLVRKPRRDETISQTLVKVYKMVRTGFPYLFIDAL